MRFFDLLEQNLTNAVHSLLHCGAELDGCSKYRDSVGQFTPVTVVRDLYLKMGDVLVRLGLYLRQDSPPPPLSLQH